tara:strand:- start:1181 stop:1954 length:774 start_codon:yes stop_codon:yes gene_type:complete
MSNNNKKTNLYYLKIFLRKIFNTFFQVNLFSINYSKFYNKKSFIFTLLAKFIWFIPSNFQAIYWKNSENLKHGHEHFTEMSGNEYQFPLLLKKEICYYASKDDKILDVCCSVGRMLNALSEDGYSKLYGFDINKIAIDQSKKVFVNLKNADLVSQSAEEYLPTRVNNEFDIVFALSASLELIPANFPLVQEISRITKKYFICIISDHDHAYPRFWSYEFKRNNFTILKCYKVARQKKDIKNASHTMFVLKKINRVLT